MHIIIKLLILLSIQGLRAEEQLKAVDLGKVELSSQLRADLDDLLKPSSIAQAAQSGLVGALYDCKNFCKFISFLGSPILKVELPKNTELSSLRFIHRRSPEFTALFGKEAVDHAEQDMITKQEGFRRQQNTVDGEITDEPDEPRDLASYWLAYSFEPIYRQSNLKTEYSLQENFETKPFFSYRGNAEIAPNLRFKIKGHKIYTSFYAAFEISPQRESMLNENFTMQTSEYEYAIRVYTPKWGGRVGIGGFVLKHKDAASTESVKGYTTEFDAKGISINVDYEKFKFDLNYSLSVAVFDSQFYRTQPFTGQWTRLRIGYCREKLSLGVLEFDSCLGLVMTQNQQTARLSPNIDFTGQSINYEENYQGIFWTLSGGDRMREKMK